MFGCLVFLWIRTTCTNYGPCWTFSCRMCLAPPSSSTRWTKQQGLCNKMYWFHVFYRKKKVFFVAVCLCKDVSAIDRSDPRSHLRKIVILVWLLRNSFFTCFYPSAFTGCNCLPLCYAFRPPPFRRENTWIGYAKLFRNGDHITVLLLIAILFELVCNPPASGMYHFRADYDIGSQYVRARNLSFFS